MHPGAIPKNVLCSFYLFFEYLIFVATMGSNKILYIKPEYLVKIVEVSSKG